jgi:hypothetical protein
MQAAVLAATPALAAALRRLLGGLHGAKAAPGVDALLLRLYRPILFRGLAAANAAVRRNALHLLLAAFPLQASVAAAPARTDAAQAPAARAACVRCFRNCTGASRPAGWRRRLCAAHGMALGVAAPAMCALPLCPNPTLTLVHAHARRTPRQATRRPTRCCRGSSRRCATRWATRRRPCARRPPRGSRNCSARSGSSSRPP